MKSGWYELAVKEDTGNTASSVIGMVYAEVKHGPTAKQKPYIVQVYTDCNTHNDWQNNKRANVNLSVVFENILIS